MSEVGSVTSFSLSPPQLLDPAVWAGGHAVAAFPDFSNSFLVGAPPFNTALHAGDAISDTPPSIG